MVPVLILVGFAVGFFAIASACYHWIRSRTFGLAGVVLSIVGIALLGASLWVSVVYAAPRPDTKPADNTAVHRFVEDSNAKTVAALTALKESNKQLSDQIQQFAKQVQENQDRALSDVESHILAIRTALSDRPLPQPRRDTGSSNSKPKQQPPKTR
jgi:hypothetical protein